MAVEVQLTDALRIASVRFSLSCETAGAALGFRWSSYAAFVARGAAPAPGDIPVRLTPNPFPASCRQTRLFDSGEAQYWYRDGGEYVIDRLVPPVSGPPLWTARFPPDVSEVTVYFSPKLVSTNGEQPVIDCPLSYPLDQLVMMVRLSTREGALHHAAGAVIAEKAYLFLGRSTAGKTTLSTMLRGCGSIELLSDDRIITRRIDGKYVAFGTPWPGDAGIARDAQAPLAGLFFLCKSDTNRLAPVHPAKVVERLFPVTSIPWFDPPLFSPLLTYLEALARDVPAFDLHFTKDAGTAAAVMDMVAAATRREGAS